jgi:alkylation response protein AidB-like acyl-CoA dehydrogenase
MDVVQETESKVPAEYERYRTEVREFIRANAPRHSNNRGPDTPEDVHALMSFLRKFVAAGYPLTAPYGITGDQPVDPIERRIVSEALAEARIPVFVGNPVGVLAISIFGSDEQRNRFIPPFLALEHVWTQLFSEPDAGSDLASMRTAAVRDGDEYVVNGSKIWSSFAHQANFGLLPARTNPTAPKHEGISVFVLDMTTPGIKISPLRQMTRDQEFNQVFFDDVRIPASARIGEEGEGWKICRAALTAERLSVGGVARRPPMSPLPPLIHLAHSTKRAGKTLAQDADTRQDIARLHARAHALQCLRYMMMTRQNREMLGPADASVAKVLSTELRIEAFAYGIGMFGPDALYEDGELTDRTSARWWQDNFLFSRALIIGGGTNEIQRNLIAERGLGLPRDAAPG